jgi:hypothetical protein
VIHCGARLGIRLTLICESSLTPMAILKKVNAVIRTFVEISSVQEMPELKPYLRMTLTEIIMSWKAKKMHARMALKKWILLKISVTFINLVSLLVLQSYMLISQYHNLSIMKIQRKISFYSTLKIDFTISNIYNNKRGNNKSYKI